ncbi:bile acid:sodium symporter [Chryseobacterium sp. MP_3.2]|uniref:bile acid:sodium symporter n=1 Tax=Chryseobacterium sp. MP_3.2 TaxID=3071712 RepID=UPI002DF9F318|nr:sodium/bile acid cotransporter 7 [Chryseobacterium sp. MP_3.2]
MYNQLKIFNQQNIFLLLLVLMVVLGKIIPYQESYQKVFDLNAFINWGIAGIFLLYGLKLNIKEVKKDITNWRLHLLVQAATFILFPLLVFLFYGISKDTTYYSLWLSIYFLASLPSTVSSSVVMVSIAKGNVTSAIFNASVSGLIGIAMTPLLMGLFLNANGAAEGQLGEIFYQLLLKVLLPIILGLLLNPLLKHFVEKYRNAIAQFDKLIILLIVYESFSEAFLERVFSSVATEVFLILIISVLVLFFVIFNILDFITSKLNFSREDKITAQFCGSKKSLVHGSLFVMILGIPEEQKVFFLLPVMIYHSFQLFYVSWLANRLAKTA